MQIDNFIYSQFNVELIDSNDLFHINHSMPPGLSLVKQ